MSRCKNSSAKSQLFWKRATSFVCDMGGGRRLIFFILYAGMCRQWLRRSLPQPLGQQLTLLLDPPVALIFPHIHPNTGTSFVDSRISWVGEILTSRAWAGEGRLVWTIMANDDFLAVQVVASTHSCVALRNSGTRTSTHIASVGRREGASNSILRGRKLLICLEGKAMALVAEKPFSSVPPSNFLISASDPGPYPYRKYRETRTLSGVAR